MTNNYLPPDWKEKSKLEKILSIISIIFATIAIIFMIISFVSNHNYYYIYYSFLVLFLIPKGIEYWKYNKPIAITNFVCAAIFLVTEIIMLTK